MQKITTFLQLNALKDIVKKLSQTILKKHSWWIISAPKCEESRRKDLEGKLSFPNLFQGRKYLFL
jgi:hypothetical protein